MRQMVRSAKESFLLICKVDTLALRHIQALVELNPNLRFKVLFYAREVESSAVESLQNSERLQFKVIPQTQPFPEMEQVLKLFKSPLYRRREERAPLRAKVMVKMSKYSQDSGGDKRLKVLLEGFFEDFSRHGARVKLNQVPFQVKDFLSVMYQDINGRWIEVESQVRWVSVMGAEQCMGLQFIARV